MIKIINYEKYNTEILIIFNGFYRYSDKSIIDNSD